MKFNPVLVIKLFLAIFFCVGLGLTVFMVIEHVKIIGAYIVSGLFILVPGTLFYGFTFGFKISEKTARKQAEIQDSISFDNMGISYKQPIFDTTQFIEWKFIETVLYTNYQSDDHQQFIFYLTQPAVQTMTENPLILNKIFASRFGKKKKITIEDDCRNFHQISEMLEKHLLNIKPFDWTEDEKKGILLSSKTQIKNDTIKTEEFWKPNNNYDRERVVYDLLSRTFQQIKQAKNA
ncbi:hypothetical protein [Pedobacter duraquae]|uniref:Uncharacterized protein n=1 Tax=Pedobacter duraquae TaxID=425511 RepID=A0A4R6IGP3_9SPHI|nr:hypothetical protein [Pedobacter duraquae]TDO20908.1 hypothetical protein CLV32_3544 [Pedobacter duraquae]